MPLQFDDFIAQLDRVIAGEVAAATLSGPSAGAHAAWKMRERLADVALVPPLNVSVTLSGAQPPQTTWYPIDAALVPIVSRRIATFLREA
jgi:hypothetical protein